MNTEREHNIEAVRRVLAFYLYGNKFADGFLRKVAEKVVDELDMVEVDTFERGLEADKLSVVDDEPRFQQDP